jgi:aryl-alcohol dehydrogenase-like predicted oxidoreductase
LRDVVSGIFFGHFKVRTEIAGMEYRSLGRSGLEISVLSYGDQIGEDVASPCMKAAYETGVKVFDNAEAYARGCAEIWSPVAGGLLTGMYEGESRPVD